MPLRLHQTEKPCCTKDNFTPIFVIFQENGNCQFGLTQFCKKCGWINVDTFYINQEKTKEDKVMSQEMFTNMTGKVEYVCFPDKTPNPKLAELLSLKMLLFKDQRIKKIKTEANDEIRNTPNN